MVNPEAREGHRSVLVPRQPRLSRRVAAAVVKRARSFRSDILFTAGALHIDAKSTLMAFIMLDALRGQLLELSARGVDAEQALTVLATLFKSSV